ncbi:hypothetical protein JYU29_17770 [Tianweitania sp. BSSL-BM11]|uniref:ChlI/MoxR AAA lid domain-containing protein n=1 Tax=Tianweitania aestuarii TaxID=2814886 RepID=A0ABS5S3P0_9HYPH|nr:hypothetical protein [Tianweitania aestuarii]MBS9722547.1 hypothetical protein [Tianweitania aestuarii]
MSSNHRLSAWAAAEAYILARRSSSRPLSTRAAVAHLRETVADCEHTDEELVQLIAISAVRHRCPLAFDGPFKPDPAVIEQAALKAAG